MLREFLLTMSHLTLYCVRFHSGLPFSGYLCLNLRQSSLFLKERAIGFLIIYISVVNILQMNLSSFLSAHRL